MSMVNKKFQLIRVEFQLIVVFKRISLGRQEFYKKPNSKIRLEQKMIWWKVKGDENIFREKVEYQLEFFENRKLEKSWISIEIF